MTRRYKLTGCARFFIFLIVFVPIAYFGLQFFAGDDPRVQEMKEWVDDKVDQAKAEMPDDADERPVFPGAEIALTATSGYVENQLDAG